MNEGSNHIFFLLASTVGATQNLPEWKYCLHSKGPVRLSRVLRELLSNTWSL